jgi:glutathione peroxidase
VASDAGRTALSIHRFTVRTIDGREQSLAEYQGQVVLIVNVASACGYTPQYAGLESLWRQHRDRGFAVLGFPCNQFGAQESGDDAAIAAFCSLSYDVTFPMFAKIDVNGSAASPLFKYLRSAARGLLGTSRIKWNFTKFLVGRDGIPVRRFGPTDEPEAIEPQVVELLKREARSEKRD